MAWSLSNVFQHGTPPFNLSAGTDVAFFRWLARYRDVVIWYDEYTDNVDEKRFQALKSAYDGVGREKGKMSRDSRTESDKINSASVFSGQHLPQRDDNSLYSRSIVRFFVKPKGGYSKRATELYDKLKIWEEKGLSQIITTILDYRETVSSKFARTFSDIFDHYKQKLIEKELQVDDRILRNYTILSAIIWIFEKETPVDLKINPERFRDVCLEDAIDQNDKVSSSDALGTFWKLLGGLIQEMKITNTDYDINQPEGSIVKITRKSNGKKITDNLQLDEETWVLYLDFNRVYQKYMEMHRSVYGTAGIGLQTMLDYSRNHWSYLGLKAVHYFSEQKSTSAHMFDYTKLVKNGVITDFKNILPNPDEEKNKF